MNAELKQKWAAVAKSHRKETAYHEAGHVVMEWLWSQEHRIVKIDMRGNDWAEAFVRYETRYDCLDLIRASLKYPAAAKRTTIQAIMGFMAGPAAGSQFDESGENWFALLFEEFNCGFSEQSHDISKAVAVAQVLHGETGRRWIRLLETVAAWTHEAVHDPKVWPIIEALGTRLETQQTMQASTAKRIIKRAAGDDWKGLIRLHSLGRQWKRRLRSTEIKTAGLFGSSSLSIDGLRKLSRCRVSGG